MFCFHFLLRLDCVRLLQTEKIRTVSEKIKFLFSARGIRLVFWDEQAAADRATSSTRGACAPQKSNSLDPRKQRGGSRNPKRIQRYPHSIEHRLGLRSKMGSRGALSHGGNTLLARKSFAQSERPIIYIPRPRAASRGDRANSLTQRIPFDRTRA
jgi:hypothetical protein